MSTIWETAKAIEMEGKLLYESLADHAPGEQLSGAFAALAREEQRHYDIFAALEKSVPPESIAPEPVVADVTALFRAIAEELKDKNDGSVAALHDAEFAYRKALILERTSIEQYTTIQSGLTDDVQKGIVGIIIREEERHVKIIEGLAEFVHRPKEWLENAEFRHAEEY